jgi:hypothetical protein
MSETATSLCALQHEPQQQRKVNVRCISHHCDTSWYRKAPTERTIRCLQTVLILLIGGSVYYGLFVVSSRQCHEKCLFKRISRNLDVVIGLWLRKAKDLVSK